MSKSRLLQIELLLDRDDLTDAEWNALNKEANDIQEQLNAQKAEHKIKQQERERQALELALHEKNLAITDAEVDEMYSEFHKLHAGQRDANGRTFDEWFNQALSLYNISLVGNTYIVQSKAKSDNAVVWEDFVSIAHARSKILDLMKQKFRDHHLRIDRQGCDFANIPKQDI